MDVDDAGKSMEGSCESAEAGCCSHEAHTNTQSGARLCLACMLALLGRAGPPVALSVRINQAWEGPRCCHAVRHLFPSRPQPSLPHQQPGQSVHW